MNEMPVKPSREVVAENVRYWRKIREWTQAELAEKANVPQPRIAELESGKFASRTDTVDNVADALGIPPAVLFTPNEAAIPQTSS